MDFRKLKENPRSSRKSQGRIKKPRKTQGVVTTLSGNDSEINVPYSVYAWGFLKSFWCIHGFSNGHPKPALICTRINLVDPFYLDMLCGCGLPRPDVCNDQSDHVPVDRGAGWLEYVQEILYIIPPVVTRNSLDETGFLIGQINYPDQY